MRAHELEGGAPNPWPSSAADAGLAEKHVPHSSKGAGCGMVQPSQIQPDEGQGGRRWGSSITKRDCMSRNNFRDFFQHGSCDGLGYHFKFMYRILLRALTRLTSLACQQLATLVVQILHNEVPKARAPGVVDARVSGVAFGKLATPTSPTPNTNTHKHHQIPASTPALLRVP